MTPAKLRHGTVARRNDGCDCDPCKLAKTRWMKRYKVDRDRGQRRTIDSTGTRRRIQALMALGWTQSHIATAAGWRSGDNVSQVLRPGQDAVNRVTADKISRAYDQLSMRRGPSDLIARKAAGWGYLTPLHWDDETIDDPAAKPYGPESYQRIRRRDDPRPLEEIKAEHERRRDADRAAFVAEVELLLATDTVESTTRRLGYTRPDGVSARLYDCGRRDLAGVFEAVQKQKKRDAA